LPEIEDFHGQYPDLLASSGFVLLPIDDRVALASAYLPGPHRDPFDRVIAAQAIAASLTVVTRDPEIAAFGCEVLW
jgi:PIN domain nuclease of toxin-antitoxin system